jgi:hypothetical protein
MQGVRHQHAARDAIADPYVCSVVADHRAIEFTVSKIFLSNVSPDQQTVLSGSGGGTRRLYICKIHKLNHAKSLGGSAVEDDVVASKHRRAGPAGAYANIMQIAVPESPTGARRYKIQPVL